MEDSRPYMCSLRVRGCSARWMEMAAGWVSMNRRRRRAQTERTPRKKKEYLRGHSSKEAEEEIHDFCLRFWSWNLQTTTAAYSISTVYAPETLIDSVSRCYGEWMVARTGERTVSQDKPLMESCQDGAPPPLFPDFSDLAAIVASWPFRPQPNQGCGERCPCALCDHGAFEMVDSGA